MGHGIAIEFARAGYDVGLHSRSEKSLERARGMIQDSLERLRGLGNVSEQQAETVPDRVRMSTDLGEVVEDADLVIESIYEDIDAKTKLFGELDELSPDRTILASNTSSFLPSRLAAATTRPGKVVNAHFLNPPFLVPLVEVVPTEETSEETTRVVMELLTSLGKQPILVEREVPGFVASRLQMALLREALWLVENEVASAEDVDIAISAGLGRRWATAGVLHVLEVAGWDLISRVAADVFPHLSNADDPALLRDMVERGDSGVKAGKGFYEWTPEKAEELRRRIAKGLVEIDRWGGRDDRSLELQKVKYENLTAKQKEIFNFQKVAALLADYGFNCIKLDDDWKGADFLAYHKEGETLKVQLKGHGIGIYKKYEGKDLWMCFFADGSWYLIPHDKLIEIMGDRTNWLNTKSWEEDGTYINTNPTKDLLESISEFVLRSDACTPTEPEIQVASSQGNSSNSTMNPERSRGAYRAHDVHNRARAKLVEHGFDLLELEQHGRLMAEHEDANQVIEVQLKPRASIDRRYVGQELHLCFPINKDDEERWYLIPHDKLVEIVGERTNWLNTRSWRDNGAYNIKSPSRQLIEGITDFVLR